MKGVSVGKILLRIKIFGCQGEYLRTGQEKLKKGRDHRSMFKLRTANFTHAVTA